MQCYQQIYPFSTDFQKLCQNINLQQVGTLRTISSPRLGLAPSPLFCPSVISIPIFVDDAGPWQMFFFRNFTEDASSPETEQDFLFSKHFSHRHLKCKDLFNQNFPNFSNNRVSNTVFSFFFFSWHKYFNVEGLVEKRTLSSMLVSPSITNSAPRHFVIKSVF